jgi:hypothetical protein
MHIPRPCRLRVERVGSLAGQLGIGEPLAGYLAHGQREPIGIIQRVISRRPIVKPRPAPRRSGQGGRFYSRTKVPSKPRSKGTRNSRCPEYQSVRARIRRRDSQSRGHHRR